jgi:hypothetical protein
LMARTPRLATRQRALAARDPKIGATMCQE